MELADTAVMSMISIKNLQKRFGKKQVLKNLNLEVEKGEFFVMLGPNGAGKTTFIKILSTLMKPTTGSVKINGHDIKEEPIELRNSIGVISHNPFLFSDLTLMENLMFYSRMYGLKKDTEMIKNLIDEVGLLDRLDDRVGEFSNGIAKCASFARILIHDPQVLLLDEPFTGLDIKSCKILTEKLKRFHEDKKTIFLTTNNIELGYELGERLTILENGEIIFDVKKEDIELEAFKDKYQSLMEAQE